MANRRSPTKPRPCLRPGEKTPTFPHCGGKTREVTVYWLEGSEGPSFTGNLPPARGWRYLRFKDFWKRDMRTMDIEIDIKRWENIPNDRSRWRHDLHRGLRRGEKKRRLVAAEKSSRRKTRRWHRGRAYSHEFCAIETVNPMWNCTAITDSAMSSAAEVQHFGRRSMVSRDRRVPRNITYFFYMQTCLYNHK